MNEYENYLDRYDIFNQAYNDYKSILKYLLEKQPEYNTEDLFLNVLEFNTGLLKALSDIEFNLHNSSEWYFKKKVRAFYELMYIFYDGIFRTDSEKYPPEFVEMIRTMYFQHYRNNQIIYTDFANPLCK